MEGSWEELVLGNRALPKRHSCLCYVNLLPRDLSTRYFCADDWTPGDMPHRYGRGRFQLDGCKPWERQACYDMALKNRYPPEQCLGMHLLLHGQKTHCQRERVWKDALVFLSCRLRVSIQPFDVSSWQSVAKIEVLPTRLAACMSTACGSWCEGIDRECPVLQGVFSEHFQTQHSPVSLLEMRKNSWQVHTDNSRAALLLLLQLRLPRICKSPNLDRVLQGCELWSMARRYSGRVQQSSRHADWNAKGLGSQEGGRSQALRQVQESELLATRLRRMQTKGSLDLPPCLSGGWPVPAPVAKALLFLNLLG